ncbi:mechanosensitive ion channel family protein [Syntrophotalea carbinolica DSM 2380]|uniref:Mechanosensitive ion channel family protein n=1 Tax=Syntrophotalea carbinolica (strain DSM 2380 / NBRC 103641 / GraBd1) TaxID=338963 RepID=Q3A1P9_SYNC1|nr:mechanosensitive ion channel domain-containing protein [Syntrophotalea carbinolica]ABA89708.1 mechanosensitive ion channel family protein [Syntrophotalea carbinolica DSM 2380]
MNQIKPWLTVYGLNLLGAVLILAIGLWLSKLISKLVRRLMKARALDPTLIAFCGNLIYASLVTFVIIAALSKLGVQTASLIAVLGAAGLAVGLSLQSSLSNFAAGIMMIVLRPFKAGDFIEGGGIAGTVELIHIFSTRLKTPDNRTVIVPNAKLLGDNIINYTERGTRRMDLVIGVSYEDDIRQVKQTLLDIIAEDKRFLTDPAPVVALHEFADSSLNFVMRPWISVKNYWPTYFDTMEKIKLRFDEAGICIPFPQRDVHLVPAPENAD